ncbi:MAG: hypothetical protein KatS3mg102_2858 [Planctomycetota bacterium]|nr:MAG: hypothetical protein KatS3mg102_2858 [Planctomycetota bacterium]
MVVAIEPARRLAPLWLRERGELRARRARALGGGAAAAHRRARARGGAAAAGLGRAGGSRPSSGRSRCPRTAGPGNALVLELECAEVTAVFTGFGQRGVRAEQVAAQVCEQARRWLEAGGPGGGAPGGPSC